MRTCVLLYDTEARVTVAHQTFQLRGYCRARRVAELSRETERNRVRDRNACHRVTTALVRAYGRIAVEDLPIPNMTRSAQGTREEPGATGSQPSARSTAASSSRAGDGSSGRSPTRQHGPAGIW